MSFTQPWLKTGGDAEESTAANTQQAKQDLESMSNDAHTPHNHITLCTYLFQSEWLQKYCVQCACTFFYLE